MLVIIIVCLVIIVGFLAHYYLDKWLWTTFGRGAPVEEGLVSSKLYIQETTLASSAILYRLAADDGIQPKLLYLMGLNASAKHKTQYMISSAFLQAGFSVYLLEYSSVVNPCIKPCPATWSLDIRQALAYLEDCQYVVARSMSCPIMVKLLAQEEVVGISSVAFITPMSHYSSFACTRFAPIEPVVCYRSIPESVRVYVYYYDSDLLMYPCCKCCKTHVCLTPPEGTNETNIHCQGPVLQRNYIAKDFFKNKNL